MTAQGKTFSHRMLIDSCEVKEKLLLIHEWELTPLRWQLALDQVNESPAGAELQ